MFREILCTRSAVSSYLLRFVLFSRWSHSAVLDDETGLVYEATAKHGFRRRPAADFFADYPKHEIRTIPVAPVNTVSARRWLDAQIGKPYDWTAIAGFVVRYFTGDMWHDADSWFCSEVTETFRSRYAIPRFRAGAWRITPGHQDMAI